MSRAITGARQPRYSPVATGVSLPFGMESKAPGVVAGDDAHTAQMRELNFFPTPPWAARAGGELIRMLDPGEGWNLWEPACGEGHMAGPLREMFPHVMASDVHPYGFGAVLDFLSGDHSLVEGMGPDFAPDWVVTNPPFAKAEAFVQRGLQVARRGVAVLCRLAFAESVGRYPLMRKKAVTAPFAERVPMQLGRWDPDLSSATAYAWFVWLQPAALESSPIRAAIEAAWTAEGSLERIIPPGTCVRLTRPDDRHRYAGEPLQGELGL